MIKEEMILKLIGDGYLIEQVWAKDFRELVLQIKVWDHVKAVRFGLSRARLTDELVKL